MHVSQLDQIQLLCGTIASILDERLPCQLSEDDLAKYWRPQDELIERLVSQYALNTYGITAYEVRCALRDANLKLSEI